MENRVLELISWAVPRMKVIVLFAGSFSLEQLYFTWLRKIHTENVSQDSVTQEAMISYTCYILLLDTDLPCVLCKWCNLIGYATHV